METLNLFANYSLLVLLITSGVTTQEETDAAEKVSDNKHNKRDDNIVLNQGNEHSGFENHLKVDLQDVKKREFCDQEKEDCSDGVTATSSSFNSKETITDDSDSKVEPAIEINENTVSSAEIDQRTKTNIDVNDSEDRNLEVEKEKTDDKDDKDTKISDTKPDLLTIKEVLQEDKLEEENTELKKNVTSNESNSTIYQWLKFILDPFIEEFKDGIYPKLADKTNITLSNVSVVSENITIKNETVNVTIAEPKNLTETESNNTTETGRKVKFQCTGKNVTDNTNATVKLITTAQLLQLLNFDKNDTENVTDCLLVMFYAPWCHFCANVAPHYNALARAFPQLDFVAVDTAQFSNLLARFGTVSVPNILVFHQSRAAVKFNQTDRTFDNFVTFVTNSTGLEANSTVNVTDEDYIGPVPSVPTNEPDYLLLISWLFVILCSSCMFVKSSKGQQWINRVRVLWQEHQHID